MKDSMKEWSGISAQTRVKYQRNDKFKQIKKDIYTSPELRKFNYFTKLSKGMINTDDFKILKQIQSSIFSHPPMALETQDGYEQESLETKLEM